MSMLVGKPYYALCFVVWIITLIAIPWLGPLDHSTIRVTVFLGSLVGTALLLVGIGVDVAERPLGVLQSGRNTYSLSRLQMAMWTLLILSALAAVAVCRAWGLFPDVTDAGSHAATAATALNISIPTELFEVMGISYFTGAAVPTLLSLKSQTSNTQAQVNFASARLGEPINATGSIFHRPSSAPPLLADLVQGDDLASAGTVDLSKVQQLLITFLLVGIYFVMLWQLFSNGSASVPVTSTVGGASATVQMTQMPGFSSNFVALLGLSHAGYLAYKAAPGVTPAGSAAASPIATPQPLLRPAPPDRI